MRKFIISVLVSLLTGLLGFIFLFLISSLSGRAEIGFLATCLLVLYLCVHFARANPGGWWYTGAAITIPFWLIMIFWAEPGQLRIYFWGLIVLVAISYAGTGLGIWLDKKKIRPGILFNILLLGGSVATLSLLIIILNRPQPIPAEKMQFVGTWSTRSGFVLTIMPEGTAKMVQNVSDTGFEFENLNIKVGPSYITDLRVRFRGDTGITVSRPGYYAREYRIDKSPYADSGNYKIVLNGAVLVKK
jgi:hypothetical protein